MLFISWEVLLELGCCFKAYSRYRTRQKHATNFSFSGMDKKKKKGYSHEEIQEDWNVISVFIAWILHTKGIFNCVEPKLQNCCKILL